MCKPLFDGEGKNKPPNGNNGAGWAAEERQPAEGVDAFRGEGERAVCVVSKMETESSETQQKATVGQTRWPTRHQRRGLH